MLCDLCCEFASSISHSEFSTRWNWNEEKKWSQYEHACLRTIKASARAGCGFCKFFVAANRWCDQPLEGKNPEKSSWISSSHVFGDETSERPNWFTFHASSIEVIGETFEPLHVNPRPITSTPGSPEEHTSSEAFPLASIRCARSWLTECETAHPQCRRKVTTLPTRVVDVGGSSAGNDVRLRETHGQAGKYVTLSYCWGKSTPKHRTTLENYSASLQSINLADVPRTLQDAIAYTRALGFRFVWIDSLCIVQDDDNDWRQESARMCSVYEGATLSLSVLDAEDCDEGFLFRRQSGGNAAVGEGDAPIFLRRKDSSYDLALRDSCLQERAWPLQERLLAPAVLDFAIDGMYWQCCAGSASQGAPEISPMTQSDTISTKPTDQAAMSDTRLKLRSSLPPADALSSWYSLVESYTKRALSRESDRGAAIQGLATRYQGFRDDQYIAGLWSGDLQAGLLWHKVGGQSGKGDTFPSWSWITAGAPVIFEAHLSSVLSGPPSGICPRAEIKVMHHESETAGSQRQAPFLQIQGSCQKGTLRSLMGGTTCQFHPSAQSGEASSSRILCGADALSAHASPADIPRWTREDGHWIRRDVFCLLIASQRHETEGLRNFYLILERIEPSALSPSHQRSSEEHVSSEGVPCFRRIGCGHSFVKEDEDDFPVDKSASKSSGEDEEFVSTLQVHQALEKLMLI